MPAVCPAMTRLRACGQMRPKIEYFQVMNRFPRLIRFVCASLLLAGNINAGAQKNDYIWLTGYDSWAPDSTAAWGFRYGNSKMDFNYSPVNISFDSLQMFFDVTNTSFCDSDGNLLFYTNGVYAA